jgi:hypothetical protein
VKLVRLQHQRQVNSGNLDNLKHVTVVFHSTSELLVPLLIMFSVSVGLRVETLHLRTLCICVVLCDSYNKLVVSLYSIHS